MQEYQFICRSGSDASYDLIVEAISPRPPSGVIVEALDEQQRELGEQVIAQLGPFDDRDGVGYRVRLFQRTPELWVWVARFEALRAKLDKVQP